MAGGELRHIWSDTFCQIKLEPLRIKKIAKRYSTSTSPPLLLPMSAGCALAALISAPAAIAARSPKQSLPKPKKSGESGPLAATLPSGIVHHK